MLAASLTVSECTDAVAYFGHPGGLEMCHRHHQRLRPRAPVKVKLWGMGAVRGPCITGGRANSPFRGLGGDARITR